MELKNSFEPYLDLINREIQDIQGYQDVQIFYEPINYVLNLHSKKIRPLVVMLSAGAVGGDIKSAVYPAAAVELLHNFTLVHDDIMDNDNVRRGKPTVHVKWDLNTAILAGDGLMGFSFQKLLKTPSGDVQRMVTRLTEAMIIICEGQGLDKMFEHQNRVSSEAYLDMIQRKTAALIELSCELGALSAEASEDLVEDLRQFGLALGMGFQIQDDILDIVADERDLGKKVGSDFAMNKMTILSILLREELGDAQFFKLNLSAYREALESTRILSKVQEMSVNYFSKAFEKLNKLPDNIESKLLQELTQSIKDRSW
jgi:geranylgeranyl pyrophosphate synthase